MSRIYIKNIQKLVEIRKILNNALYPGHSLVTYDLILIILEAYLDGKSLTIKDVCTSSNRSLLNTRKHLNLLLDYGWIDCSIGIHDKRLRLISASSKLIMLVEKIIDN